MKNQKFTKEEIEEIVNYVNERGASRQKVQGKDFNDVDFARESGFGVLRARTERTHSGQVDF